MTDDMIHASTDGLEGLSAAAAVIERRGDAIQFIDDEIMTNLIKLFGRDARLNVLADVSNTDDVRGRLLSYPLNLFRYQSALSLENPFISESCLWYKRAARTKVGLCSAK